MAFFETNDLGSEQSTTSSIISNNEANSYLLEIAKWAKLLAIVGYIAMGIIILFSLVGMIFGSQMGTLYGGVAGFGMFFMYLIIALAYYFPSTFLYKYSKQIKEALNRSDNTSAVAALGNLKSFFKFTGIFVLVMIVIYALILVVGLPMIMVMMR